MSQSGQDNSIALPVILGTHSRPSEVTMTLGETTNSSAIYLECTRAENRTEEVFLQEVQIYTPLPVSKIATLGDFLF